MRVHAATQWHIAQNLKITSDGQEVRGCMWFDTDEGIAECNYMRKTSRGFYAPIYANTDEYDIDGINIPTYYLHNFEVWNNKTGELITKV